MLDNFALVWGIAGLAFVLWRIIRLQWSTNITKSRYTPPGGAEQP